MPELFEVEELADQNRDLLNVEILAEVSDGKYQFPDYGMNLGSQKPDGPVFALFGGVHGLERIGSHVLLSFLKTLLYRVRWKKDHRYARTMRRHNQLLELLLKASRYHET